MSWVPSTEDATLTESGHVVTDLNTQHWQTADSALKAPCFATQRHGLLRRKAGRRPAFQN
jgi:hypothetical protein